MLSEESIQKVLIIVKQMCSMCGSINLSQRGSKCISGVVLFFLFVFGEGREDPNITNSRPSSGVLLAGQ